jgi:uncharacterized protein
MDANPQVPTYGVHVPELPMFPLGTVLLPHMVLPLHVFEPRYRALMYDVLAGEREFGVVLINRGHEVGGGDERSTTGTVARIVQAEELEDGRWLTLAVGTRRLRVTDWLLDDPYPRAEVRELDDRPDETELGEIRALLDQVAPRVRRVLGMQAELGEDGVPPTVELDPDPVLASWQLAVVTPLTPFDAQQVLETDGVADRLRTLDALLGGVEETYAFRLAADG